MNSYVFVTEEICSNKRKKERQKAQHTYFRSFFIFLTSNDQRNNKFWLSCCVFSLLELNTRTVYADRLQVGETAVTRKSCTGIKTIANKTEWFSVSAKKSCFIHLECKWLGVILYRWCRYLIIVCYDIVFFKCCI